MQTMFSTLLASLVPAVLFLSARVSAKNSTFYLLAAGAGLVDYGGDIFYGNGNVFSLDIIIQNA